MRRLLVSILLVAGLAVVVGPAIASADTPWVCFSCRSGSAGTVEVVVPYADDMHFEIADVAGSNNLQIYIDNVEVSTCGASPCGLDVLGNTRNEQHTIRFYCSVACTTMVQGRNVEHIGGQYVPPNWASDLQIIPATWTWDAFSTGIGQMINGGLVKDLLVWWMGASLAFWVVWMIRRLVGVLVHQGDEIKSGQDQAVIEQSKPPSYGELTNKTKTRRGGSYGVD